MLRVCYIISVRILQMGKRFQTAETKALKTENQITQSYPAVFVTSFSVLSQRIY